jgi:hypothetical protein
MGRKSWALSSSADAFKVKMVDPESGSPSPEIVAGGGCLATVFALPYDKEQRVATHFSYSRRRSFWNIFNSASASNVAIIYISGSDEKPADSEKIIKALTNLVGTEEQPESRE